MALASATVFTAAGVTSFSILKGHARRCASCEVGAAEKIPTTCFGTSRHSSRLALGGAFSSSSLPTRQAMRPVRACNSLPGRESLTYVPPELAEQACWIRARGVQRRRWKADRSVAALRNPRVRRCHSIDTTFLGNSEEEQRWQTISPQ